MLNVIYESNMRTGYCTLDLAIHRTLVSSTRPVSWYAESKSLFGMVKEKMGKKRIRANEYIFCNNRSTLLSLATEESK